MALRAARLSVDATEDLIADARESTDYIITNRDSANSVYVGATGVLNTTGYELKAGETLTLSLRGEDKAYAVTAGSTVILHILKA